MIDYSNRSYTGLHDVAADALLADALLRIRRDVEAFVAGGGAAKRIISVVMGGGYARGEGGVRNGHLCNDVDFYTVVEESASAAEMDAIFKALEKLAEPYTAELGAEVEFSYPKRPSRIMHDCRRVMIQELLRANVHITGKAFSEFAPEFPPENLPAGEAARMLMNRGMGLLFASEKMDADGRVKPEDVDFTRRNINKAVLGAGDADLIARREYAWQIQVRAERVGSAAYAEAVAEKFSPQENQPDNRRLNWCAARDLWKESLAMLRERCGRELGGRSLWEAARWIGRRRTLGRVWSTGKDCTVRVLDKIAAELEQDRPSPSKSLVRDWQIFN